MTSFIEKASFGTPILDSEATKTTIYSSIASAIYNFISIFVMQAMRNPHIFGPSVAVMVLIIYCSVLSKVAGFKKASKGARSGILVCLATVVLMGATILTNITLFIIKAIGVLLSEIGSAIVRITA